MRSKKGHGTWSIITLTVLFIFVAAWGYSYFQRECNTNADCTAGNYCGSDFACHAYPDSQALSILWPSIILGLSIIIAAAILRWEQIRATLDRHKKAKQQTLEESTPDALDEYEDESSFSQK